VLAKNTIYVDATVGYILVTFGVGGMADWMPTYLERIYKVGVSDAGLYVGAATVIGGFGGTFVGGYFADRLKGKTRQPYFCLCCLALIPTVIFVCIILAVPNLYVSIAMLIYAQICLWASSGPINAITANCVTASVRARAFSFQNLLLHLLGDAISPSIIGAISDATNSLRNAAILLPVSIFLACIAWGVGWRFVAELPVANQKETGNVDALLWKESDDEKKQKQSANESLTSESNQSSSRSRSSSTESSND